MSGGEVPARPVDVVVELVPSDPRWPLRFAAAADELRRVLPDAVIEHVGSTSVRGLASKDTIDVAAGVPDVEAALTGPTIAALARLGYAFVPASFADDPDHAFFERVEGDRRTVHLHVMALGREPFTDHLLFRDLLRADPAAAARYAAEKQRLAERYRDRRDEYVRRKQPVVQALLAEARARGRGAAGEGPAS